MLILITLEVKFENFLRLENECTKTLPDHSTREQRLKVIIIIICLFNRSLSSKNDLIILDYTIQNNATHTSDAAENFDYLLRRHFADFNFLLRATTSVTLGYRLPADNRYPKWSENTTLICSKLHLNSPSKYSFTNFDQLHKNFRKIVFVMLADWAPEATGKQRTFTFLRRS